MKLVIAEKPSVAMSLAAVLGATERKDGYLEGSGYLVSWCVGHLLELAQPEAYKEQYAKWRYEDLPILPENWKYEVPKDKKTQLALLCRLMKDKRVDSVVCATDAGREGELIFRLVYEYAGCKKPMERLWISSMEDAAIREGFDHLHPGSDYDKLYDAAVCRAGADWLIGINATRLFSVLYGVTLNVGRVMSPTLALLVQRESDIESFISKPFYVPEITCGGFTASGEKMTERSEAEKIRMDCDHNSAFVRSVEKQVKTIQPPRLYDLTTLQRECNRIYGYRRISLMRGSAMRKSVTDVRIILECLQEAYQMEGDMVRSGKNIHATMIYPFVRMLQEKCRDLTEEQIHKTLWKEYEISGADRMFVERASKILEPYEGESEDEK